MHVVELVYFFVPVFAFATLIELLHFLPFVGRITEEKVFGRMYSVMLVFLLSLLVFELSFLAKYYLASELLHKLLEISAMSAVLFETVVVVRRSVAELMVAEATREVLEREERRYRSLIETMNDGFWAIDSSGRTTMVNHKVREMLGYSEKELIGKHVFSFLDEKAREEVERQLKLRKQGVSSTYEIEIIRKDGKKLPVLLSASPIFESDGTFKGSFAVVTDISRLKEMEAQLREYSQNLELMVEERTRDLRTARDSLMNMLEDLRESKRELAMAYEELKDIDRLKTDIISNVSHELRTPITIAKSAVELSREETESKEIRKYLTMCDNALSRLNELVENLVGASILYRGGYKPELELVDVRDVIKEVVASHEAQAREKGVKLSFNTRARAKARVDVNGLRRILSNLLDNAIKFNNPGGEVKINVENKDGFVRLSVADTGIGMEKGQLDRIWEPFYQIDPSTTRQYGGTGIGLTLVKSYVEAMKGRVEVESEPGRGSTFHVYLPSAGKG